MPAPVAATARPASRHGNASTIFILVLTGLSLVVLVLLVLPLTPATLRLLLVYNNLICGIFLGDCVRTLRAAPSQRASFLGERGWLDLIGAFTR